MALPDVRPWLPAVYAKCRSAAALLLVLMERETKQKRGGMDDEFLHASVYMSKCTK